MKALNCTWGDWTIMYAIVNRLYLEMLRHTLIGCLLVTSIIRNFAEDDAIIEIFFENLPRCFFDFARFFIFMRALETFLSNKIRELCGFRRWALELSLNDEIYWSTTRAKNFYYACVTWRSKPRRTQRNLSRNTWFSFTQATFHWQACKKTLQGELNWELDEWCMLIECSPPVSSRFYSRDELQMTLSYIVECSARIKVDVLRKHTRIKAISDNLKNLERTLKIKL